MAQKTIKQETFVWEGVDKKGKRKKGELNGQNMSLVKADLRRQGINPIKVKKKPKSLFGSGKGKGRKIIPKDIALFSRQLATMMSSGVPLVQSFEIMAKGNDNATMRTLIDTIRSDIEGGATLTDALRRHPKYFDDLTCNLVNAGEQAGILESLLNKIATYKEKTEALKSKIKKALFYPTAVIAMAFIVTAVLLIFVIPQFQDLFADFGADLPALTQFVINLSDAFQSYWYLIFGGIAAFGFAFSETKKRSKKFRDTLEIFSLKLPVIGDILLKAALARFARTLSTMFAAGVPLVDAMESVAGAVGNAKYRDAIMTMRDEVASGTAVTTAMEQANVFPNMMVQMASIGEEAGSLDSMMGKVADFYEQEVDDAVDALSSLLEPLIMAVLGVLVGGLVISMYLPIFKMGSAI
jgi:type IV pilus assembly protein PilC